MLSQAEPGELARTYLDHALAGRDAEAAQTLIEPLVAESIDLIDLFEHVLAPTAHRVGDLWHEDRISVADEHFVTQLNQRLIVIAGTLRPPLQSSAERVILACPRDEQHDTGLRMIAELLTAHGYEVSMLGAATPVSALLDFVDNNPALAVGLSIASPLAIGSLATTTAGLREAQPRLPIFIGGRCAERYPAISAAVGAHTCANTRDTLAFLDGLRAARETGRRQ